MSDFSTNPTDSRHLSAFFDDRADAERAISRLRDLGLSDASVRMSGGDDYSTRPDSREPGGLWDSISDFFFPTDERETYAEGLRRGGYLVTVTGVPAAQFDEVVDILDDEGSVDLDERSENWRSEGWQGSDAAGGGYGGARVGDPDPVTTSLRGDDVSGIGLGTGVPASSLGSEDRSAGYENETAGTSGLRSGTDQEVIPVVEEQIRVGKRDTSLGRVRVRSYVVEEPVSEDVNLRSDRVEIERRPVDRPLGAGDAGFTDRTIEAEERVEQAVVEKEARVVEEIGLRKTSDERTETISDTVRRTEVEVEDDRDETSRDPSIRNT